MVCLLGIGLYHLLFLCWPIILEDQSWFGFFGFQFTILIPIVLNTVYIHQGHWRSGTEFYNINHNVGPSMSSDEKENPGTPLKSVDSAMDSLEVK